MGEESWLWLTSRGWALAGPLCAILGESGASARCVFLLRKMSPAAACLVVWL